MKHRSRKIIWRRRFLDTAQLLLASGAGSSCLCRWRGLNVGWGPLLSTGCRPSLHARDAKLVSGNVTLERIAGVPPVRPLTRASMVLLEYAAKLTIALRTDPRHFRPEDTRALLDAYVAKLSRTIATAV